MLYRSIGDYAYLYDISPIYTPSSPLFYNVQNLAFADWLNYHDPRQIAFDYSNEIVGQHYFQKQYQWPHTSLEPHSNIRPECHRLCKGSWRFLVTRFPVTRLGWERRLAVPDRHFWRSRTRRPPFLHEWERTAQPGNCFFICNLHRATKCGVF